MCAAPSRRNASETRKRPEHRIGNDGAREDFPMRQYLWRIACGIMLLAGAATVTAEPLFSPTQDPLAGSRVFGAKGCARCHAVGGVGATVGPDLGRVARPRTFYDLGAALWNHAGGMAQRMRQLGIARPTLDATEMGDLIAFLFTVDYFDARGDAVAGGKVFADKRCIACHQVGGTGGVVGPSLDADRVYESPIALAAAMWNHGPQMAEAMRARGIARPVFKGSELRDLIAFVSATPGPTGARQAAVVALPGRVDEGRRLYADKRCASCHDGSVAPDLAQRAANRSLVDFAAAMWNKAPVMADAMRKRNVPVPQLSAAEVADLVAYLYSVRYFAGSGDPRNGVKVVAAKGCLDCHALHGERGKRAPDLARATSPRTPAGVMSALWNHSFIAGGERAGAAWPSLRPEEVADVIAYLATLKAATR
jgi:mono/diheme cytochrome c family protein